MGVSRIAERCFLWSTMSFTAPLATIASLFDAAVAANGGNLPKTSDDWGVAAAFLPILQSSSEKVTKTCSVLFSCRCSVSWFCPRKFSNAKYVLCHDCSLMGGCASNRCRFCASQVWSRVACLRVASFVGLGWSRTCLKWSFILVQLWKRAPLVWLPRW